MGRLTLLCCVVLCVGLASMPSLEVRSIDGRRVAAAGASAPAQQNVCIPPPKCKWRFDQNGAPHPVCGPMTSKPPLLGIVCQHHLPDYFMQYAIAAAISMAFVCLNALWVFLMRRWIESVMADWIPWTRMSTVAFAMGLAISWGFFAQSGLHTMIQQ